MEIMQRLSFDNGNRRLSSCSFSNYSRMSFSEEMILEKNNKLAEPSFFTVSMPNSTRTFSPHIIISSTLSESEYSCQKKKRKGTVNRADCIRKRIKTHFNQYLLKVLNRKINTAFPNLTLGKLSQRFIADVKIEPILSNEHILQTIFRSFCIATKLKWT